MFNIFDLLTIIVEMIETKFKKSKNILLFILAFVLAFSVTISTIPQKTAKALTVNEILNSAELHPIKTGYKSLDKQKKLI